MQLLWRNKKAPAWRGSFSRREGKDLGWVVRDCSYEGGVRFEVGRLRYSLPKTLGAAEKFINMPKRLPPIAQDFLTDKLTNSIENVATGEVFDTEITLLAPTDKAQIKKADWQFEWHKELKDKTKAVYKLTTVNNPNIIQGLLSLEDKGDHIFMHLIERKIQ